MICEDLGDLPDLAIVACADMSEQFFGPAPVRIGETFTVNGGAGPLPEVIYCTISNQNGDLLQWNMIDTSVNEPLYLKEQYGAFQVEGCNNQQCLQGLDMTYTIVNGGSHSLNVVDVARSFNGEQSESLVDMLSSNPLALGETAVVEEAVGLDICQTVSLLVAVDVDGQPDDGPECDDSSELVFGVAPQCVVDVDLTCAETGTLLDCQELQSLGTPPCVCRDCATSLSFVYTGNSCAASSPSPFLMDCRDGSATKPSTVFVNVNNPDGVSLFSGPVQEGDMVTVANEGACLPDSITFVVSDPTASPMVIYQAMDLSIGCSQQGIRMSEDYGAFEFTGFGCQDGFEESCFTDITLTACAVNEGTVLKTVTEMELVFEGDTTDLLNGAIPSLETGEVFCSRERATISLCGEPTFEAEVSVESDDTSGIGCNDMDALEFTPDPRPTPLPTSAPTIEPTAEPTTSPSPAPTRTPTAAPSAVPTRRPTYAPTPRPTPQPSPRPSPRQTRRPTAAPSHAPVQTKGMFSFLSVCLCAISLPVIHRLV